MGFSLFKWFGSSDSVSSKERRLFAKYLRAKDNYLSIQTDADVVEAYKRCPTVRTIIDKTAKIFSRVNQEVYRIEKDGNKTLIPNHELTKLLTEPHLLYTGREFLETFYKQYTLFRKVFIWKIAATGFENNPEKMKLLILPTQDVEIHYKTNIDLLEAENISDVIDYYEVCLFDKTIKIDPKDIWFFGTSDLEFHKTYTNETLSPCKSLEKPINTVISAYEARNVMNARKGGIGLLTNDSPKDTEFGKVSPIDDKEKQIIQDELSEYGLSRHEFQTIVTNASLKYQSMSIPVNEMELNEGIQQAKADISDGFQISLHTLNFLDGATYENKKQAEKELYTSLIIPDWEIWQASVNSEFDLLAQNFYYKLDYSFVEALQGDKKTENEVGKIQSEIILSVNEKLQGGSINFENAVNVLIFTLNISETEAEKLVNR